MWFRVVAVLLHSEALMMTMSAVKAPAKVLIVGGGPVALLASKTIAKRGYDALLITSEVEFSNDLLWEEGEEKMTNLKLIDPNSESDVDAFESAVGQCEALCIAYDSGRTLDSKLLDVLMPEKSKIRRIALMSRHLNGKGQNPLCIAAKGAANREVWALTPDLKTNIDDFEARVAEKANAKNADLVTVRVGTLKGGGPGTAESKEERAASPSSCATTLSRTFYAKVIAKDLVNWQLLFDCGTQGIQLTPGDTAEGPGWKAVFASTSPEPEAGDSGRVATAQALALVLDHPDAGGKSFGIGTASARVPPDDAAWASSLQAVFAKAS